MAKIKNGVGIIKEIRDWLDSTLYINKEPEAALIGIVGEE